MALQLEPQGLLFAEVGDGSLKKSTKACSFIVPFLPDQVLEPDDHAEAQAAPPEEDLPAAGQDPAAGPDEHQRRHLGEAAQEEP